MSPYTTSSKSKTFPKESDFDELTGFVSSQIETEARSIFIIGGDELNVVVTQHKYIITITKIEEKPTK